LAKVSPTIAAKLIVFVLRFFSTSRAEEKDCIHVTPLDDDLSMSYQEKKRIEKSSGIDFSKMCSCGCNR